MRRVFEVDVLRCPRCKARPMRILAAIHPPMTTQAILKSLGLPTRAPPITPVQPVSPDWSLAEPSAERYRGGYAGLMVKPSIAATQRPLQAGIEEVTRVATIDCGQCMPYENGNPVYICKKLKSDIDQVWRALKHYD
jgi:hypothetical protein